jgi:hypothetical protein
MVEEDSDKIRVPVVWPQTAYDLVRANREVPGLTFSALVTKLVRETGNPRWACRRFAQAMGIQSNRSQRRWTKDERDKLVALIEENRPVGHVARVLRRSAHSVWHMLRRTGISTKIAKDGFTKYQLASALHVRRERIESWIQRGWLKIGQDGIITAEDFCEFCKKHSKDVIGERLKRERLEFVRLYVFPPRHAESLSVRESKKEREAYEALTSQEATKKRKVGNADIGDSTETHGAA